MAGPLRLPEVTNIDRETHALGYPAWVEIIVEVASPQAETVASFMLDLGSPGLVTEEGSRLVKLTGYFVPDAQQQLSALPVLCADLAAMEPELPPARITTRTLPQEDWAHDWQKHFPPLAVGQRLYIVPPWIDNLPSDRLSIVIYLRCDSLSNSFGWILLLFPPVIILFISHLEHDRTWREVIGPPTELIGHLIDA